MDIGVEQPAIVIEPLQVPVPAETPAEPDPEPEYTPALPEPEPELVPA